MRLSSALLLHLAVGEEPTLRWYDYRKSKTGWIHATKFCEAKGAQLCTYDQICPLGVGMRSIMKTIQNAIDNSDDADWRRHIFGHSYQHKKYRRLLPFGDEYMGQILFYEPETKVNNGCSKWYRPAYDNKPAGDAFWNPQGNDDNWGYFGVCCAFNAPPNQVVQFDYDGPVDNTWSGNTYGTYYKYVVTNQADTIGRFKLQVDGLPIRVGWSTDYGIGMNKQSYPLGTPFEIGLGERNTAKTLHVNTIRSGTASSKRFDGHTRMSYKNGKWAEGNWPEKIMQQTEVELVDGKINLYVAGELYQTYSNSMINKDNYKYFYISSPRFGYMPEGWAEKSANWNVTAVDSSVPLTTPETIIGTPPATTTKRTTTTRTTTTTTRAPGNYYGKLKLPDGLDPNNIEAETLLDWHDGKTSLGHEHAVYDQVMVAAGSILKNEDTVLPPDFEPGNYYNMKTALGMILINYWRAVRLYEDGVPEGMDEPYRLGLSGGIGDSTRYLYQKLSKQAQQMYRHAKKIHKNGSDCSKEIGHRSFKWPALTEINNNRCQALQNVFELFEAWGIQYNARCQSIVDRQFGNRVNLVYHVRKQQYLNRIKRRHAYTKRNNPGGYYPWPSLYRYRCTADNTQNWLRFARDYSHKGPAIPNYTEKHRVIYYAKTEGKTVKEIFQQIIGDNEFNQTPYLTST